MQSPRAALARFSHQASRLAGRSSRWLRWTACDDLPRSALRGPSRPRPDLLGREHAASGEARSQPARGASAASHGRRARANPGRRCGLALLALASASCSLARDAGLAPVEPDRVALTGPLPADEPAHVVVQHVLLAFEGTGVPAVTRSKADAQRLANRVLADARGGRDFADLVRLYSDDRTPEGTLEIANWGVAPGPTERERRGLARGFAATAFRLAPGEIALVEYDEVVSPFGWHVMKRIR
jgi:parvulin-like peptidyl-prolyl cis-trans isomerase-like protein